MRTAHTIQLNCNTEMYEGVISIEVTRSPCLKYMWPCDYWHYSCWHFDQIIFWKHLHQMPLYMYHTLIRHDVNAE